VVNVSNWAYHGFRNSGLVPARIQLTCTAGLEPFFRECGVRVEAGQTPSAEPPSASEIERVATIAAKHGSYFYGGFESEITLCIWWPAFSYVHATVAVGAERGARMPRATIAVGTDGGLLSGSDTVKGDAKALVPQNRVGCDGQPGDVLSPPC